MIRLIAALDLKNGIAKNGQIPWDIPADRKYFVRQTKLCGGNVLTGKKTFVNTYSGPLQGRRNFILTRERSPILGTELVFDLEEFINSFDQDLWIAGGESVFAQVLNLKKADEVYLTQIEYDFDCDQFFPVLKQDFELARRSETLVQNGLKFTYAKFRKKADRLNTSDTPGYHF
jgi:dihydrofolate reductase